jgi:hypothetical protein
MALYSADDRERSSTPKNLEERREEKGERRDEKEERESCQENTSTTNDKQFNTQASPRSPLKQKKNNNNEI